MPPLCFAILPPDRVQEHQAFRYRIFGDEMGYLNETLCPNRLDADEFDSCSTLILASHKGKPVGCCRVIYNNAHPKPSYVEKFFDLPPSHIPRTAIAELGRFALVKDVRNPCLSLLIRFGLLQLACEDALRRDVSYFYVFMHETGYALLRRSQIPFELIPDYTITGYSGYYSDYFDPSDTYPGLIDINAAYSIVKKAMNQFANR